MRDRRPEGLDAADEVDAGDPFPEGALGGGVEAGDLEDVHLVAWATLVPFGLEAIDRVAARNAIDLEHDPVLGSEPALPAGIGQQPGAPSLGAAVDLPHSAGLQLIEDRPER